MDKDLEINGTVYEHFCAYLLIFLSVCVLGKEPGDSKLILEAV